MPHFAAPGFDGPDDPNAVIWRYIDFAKLVSLLDSQSLHLARADELDDDFEGSVPHELLARRDGPESTGLAKVFGRYVSDRYRGARGYMFVNCWSLSEGESAALWTLYVPSSQGIAVRSTYRRLVDALTVEERPLFIGCVRYIDYTRETFPTDPLYENVLTPFIHKRKSFEHERELRVLWWDGEALNINMDGHTAPDDPMPEKWMEGVHPGGVTVRVNLGTLIDEVRVSPTAPNWFTDLVTAVVGRYGFNFPIVKSDLAVDPVF